MDRLRLLREGLRRARLVQNTVTLESSGYWIDFDSVVEWSYDQLKVLTDHIGTTKLDFFYYGGWRGTDVTPGEAGSFRMRVTWDD
jgi:hypothetical protein